MSPVIAKKLEQVGGMDGLDEEVEIVTADASFIQEVFHVGLTRQEQNPAIGQQVANVNSDFDACKLGHQHVANQNVGFPFACLRECGRSVVYGNGLEPISVEDDLESVGNDSFVISDEDTLLNFFSRTTHWGIRWPGEVDSLRVYSHFRIQ